MNGRLNWTLAQALAWILKQEHGLELDHDETSSIRAMLMEEDDPTLDAAQNARDELIGHLGNGRFPASASREDSGEHVIIPALYWQRLELCPDLDGDKLYERIKPRGSRGAGALVPAYRDIRVMPQDIKRFWPAPPPKGTKRLTIVPSALQTGPGPFHGKDELPPVVIRTFYAQANEFAADITETSSDETAGVPPVKAFPAPKMEAAIKLSFKIARSLGFRPWSQAEAGSELSILFPSHKHPRDRVRAIHKECANKAEHGTKRGRPRSSGEKDSRYNQLEQIRQQLCMANLRN